METLIVKNFSGSFNEKYIGHEIINCFDYDNNDTKYYIFYLPPYGSIFNEKNFFEKKDYKEGFKRIVIFEETGIANVLKLKAVAVKPENIDKKIYDELVSRVNFKGKKLTEINFGSDPDEDPLKTQEIFHITYLIKKDNYFNLENLNILIWHKSNRKCNKLKTKSFDITNKTYGKYPIDLDDTTLGQKNYCYGKDKIGKKFNKWYEDEIKPLLTSATLYKLETVANRSANLRIYDDNNLINNLHRTSDENLYTNFIQTILLQNKQLRNRFFSSLVSKITRNKIYKPIKVSIETQKQSLICLKRAVNSLIKKSTKKKKSKMYELLDKCTDAEIKEEIKKHIDNKEKFINGFIDLYLTDNKYRIVIENKIYSGINGKQKDYSDINQITTYKEFLSDLNKTEKLKTNAVIILAPESEKNLFGEYGADVIITYKDLYLFFSENKKLINRKNREDFINALAYHSLSKEDIITARFLKAL